MKFEEYLAEQQQDAEYQQAERELRPYLELANRVLALRLERGWSQAELARRTGTRQANISRIENAQANPTLKVLHKLAQAFEVDLAIELGSEPVEDQPSPGVDAEPVRILVRMYAHEGQRHWPETPRGWRPEPGRAVRRWLPRAEDWKPLLDTTDCGDEGYVAA